MINCQKLYDRLFNSISVFIFKNFIAILVFTFAVFIKSILTRVDIKLQTACFLLHEFPVFFFYWNIDLKYTTYLNSGNSNQSVKIFDMLLWNK